MTVRNVLKEGAAILNNEEANLEAQLLLQSVLSVDHAWLIAHAHDAVSDQHKTEFLKLIERRSKGEPVAYILGEREFFGLSLKVSPATLIPRPDTETLVEVAIAKMETTLKQSRPISVLDLGTGTGAIALAIAHLRPEAHVIAVDASEGALAIAQENAQNLQIENVEFHQSDWFDGLSNQMFDLIVSNPPYIEENDQHLNQGDLRFEPIDALASGQDGLDDIRKILTDCLVYLNPQGWIMLEHGYNQADAVQSLMAESGLVEIETVKDLGGNDRVTLAKNPLIVSQHWAD